MPHPLLEHVSRIVPGFGLHILRQRQSDRAGLRRRREHAHGFDDGAGQLIRTVDPIPIAGYRLERVIHGNVLAVLGLELLQHRGYIPARENITGKQQHRDAIDGGRRRPGDHVGGAGPDRRSAGERAQTVPRLGKRSSNVNRGLLITAKVIAEVRILLQGLPHPGDIAVAKNSPGPRKERVFTAIPFHVLVLEKAHQGLRHG